MELCAYCGRKAADLGHPPCSGRHSMRGNGLRGDRVCYDAWVAQGWQKPRVTHHAPVAVHSPHD